MSVVIPTYNGITRGFLFDAIDSVLRQSVSPRQILVVDDGSQDGTAQALRAKYGSLIDVIQIENGGPSRARNVALSRVTTQYAAFLDDDDLFEPLKLEKQLDALGQEPSAVMVFTAAQRFQGTGELLDIITSSGTGLTFPACILGNDFTLPSTVLVDVAAARRAGAFDESRRLAEDFDFFVRVSQVGRTIYLGEPLIKYRVHDAQASCVHSDLEKSNLSVVRAHASRVYGHRARHATNFFCYGAFLRALARRDFAFGWEILALAEGPLDLKLLTMRLCGMLLSPMKSLKARYRRYEIACVLRKLGPTAE